MQRARVKDEQGCWFSNTRAASCVCLLAGRRHPNVYCAYVAVRGILPLLIRTDGTVGEAFGGLQAVYR